MARPPPSNMQKLLKSLHDTPVDNAGASDQVLGSVYAYLMDLPPSSGDKKLHWFCDKADPTAVAAASFLLRLFAYDSPQVDQWKNSLNTCLRGCCDCVRSLERIKVDSRHT
jgi:senataxin